MVCLGNGTVLVHNVGNYCQIIAFESRNITDFYEYHEGHFGACGKRQAAPIKKTIPE